MQSTESDLSFESDDQTAAVAVVSFKGFMQQYSELSSWLGTVLQKAKRQSSCLSEKYVNQVETVLDVVSIAWLLLRQLTLKLS